MVQESFPASNLDIAIYIPRDFESEDVGFTMPVGLGSKEPSWSHVKDEYR